MKLDKVVLDTNILISLIISRRLNDLIIWSLDYNVTIYICEEMTKELISVMRRKKIKKYLTQPIADYITFVNNAATNTIIDKRFDRAPDVKDNYLFDLAYSVKSYYIVTNDIPLLNMKQVNKIKLISLKDWKDLLDLTLVEV
jgi:putative PIN family toxin of toxin-antitoxin system